MVVFSSGIVCERLFYEPASASSSIATSPPALTGLVLTGDECLRERLRRIIEACGWRCRAPAMVSAAWPDMAAAAKLAFVDIARPLEAREDDTRLLAETLAGQPGVMLVVCGSPDTPTAGKAHGADERWAREVGAFVYLPGVGTDTGLALIVDEARRISGGKRSFDRRKIARS